MSHSYLYWSYRKSRMLINSMQFYIMQLADIGKTFLHIKSCTWWDSLVHLFIEANSFCCIECRCHVLWRKTLSLPFKTDYTRCTSTFTTLCELHSLFLLECLNSIPFYNKGAGTRLSTPLQTRLLHKTVFPISAKSWKQYKNTCLLARTLAEELTTT